MKKLLLILLCFPLLTLAQQTYVPDDNFEAYLEANGMGDGIILNDSVLTSAIENISSLNINNLNISILTGIEDFVLLDSLRCNANQLQYLDMSSNIHLSFLTCKDNQITNINITNNLLLKTLWCVNNNLDTLDLTNNTSLINLTCTNNNLNTLDISNNLNLKKLFCGDNQISSLNVSNHSSLEQLYCFGNLISSLDINNNPNLIILHCSNNQISSLDISNNSFMSNIYCANNLLERLDLRNNNNSILSVISTNNSNLTCISVDDTTYSSLNWTSIDPWASFSVNCFGCTDPIACNYNSTATFDDGSCLTDYGCMDATACNYDASATCDDGSCLTDYGCMDATACNYDASATCDDGSCLTDYGCMDATACNYDASATCDDGSCYNLLSSISQNGDTLTAVTTPSGLNADWYNTQTENGETRVWLMEEDASSFTPTFDCSYFIVVIDNGCTDTSDVYSYGENAARIGSFTTSPNPTTGLINVKFDNPKNQFVMFELISNNGIKLDEFITIENNLDIDLSKYSSGSYYLYFNSEDAVQGCRLEELQKVSTKIILNK